MSYKTRVDKHTGTVIHSHKPERNKKHSEFCDTWAICPMCDRKVPVAVDKCPHKECGALFARESD